MRGSIRLVAAVLAVAVAFGAVDAKRKKHREAHMIYNLDEPGWTLAGHAQISPEFGYNSPLRALALLNQPTLPLGSTAERALPPDAVVGSRLTFSAWVNGDESTEGVTLSCYVRQGTSVAVVGSVLRHNVNPGWQLVQFGTYHVTVNPSSLVFGFGVNGSPLLANGVWVVDDIEVVEQPFVIVEDDMALDAEPIFVKLHQRLQTVPGVITCSRIWRHWADVPAIEQPAMFLATGGREPENKLGLPPTWQPSGEVWIYYRLDHPGEIPGTKINAILKAVEEVLEWRAADVVPGRWVSAGRAQTTLEGLVQYAWMGPVHVVEGIAQGQGVVSFPIEMRAAALATA